jgi:SAM-dependent methyltransferase
MPNAALVDPHELKKVKEEHWPGIFGDFRQSVTERRNRRTGKDTEIADNARFFDYLLTQVDAIAFREMQEHYLDSTVVNRNADIVKYIDPIVWFESKLRLARKIGLHKRPPLRILDLGCGPGHFPVVARFYGHDVTGTDIPSRSSRHDHLYDALCDIYRVRRISHCIIAGQAMGNVGGRYDLVTALLAAFNVDDQKRPWGVDYWRFFLTDLRANVLTENGELLLVLTNNKLTNESWNYLASLGNWTNEKSRQVFITDFAAI